MILTQEGSAWEQLQEMITKTRSKVWIRKSMQNFHIACRLFYVLHLNNAIIYRLGARHLPLRLLPESIRRLPFLSSRWLRCKSHLFSSDNCPFSSRWSWRSSAWSTVAIRTRSTRMPLKTLLVKSRVEVGILSRLPCDFCLSETFCKLLFFCWSSFTRLFHSFPQLYSFISSFCASRILSALCFMLDCVRMELWDAGIFFKQCRGRCIKGERCRAVLCRSLLFLLFFTLFTSSFAALLIAIALSVSLILFLLYNEFFFLPNDEAVSSCCEDWECDWHRQGRACWRSKWSYKLQSENWRVARVEKKTKEWTIL